MYMSAQKNRDSDPMPMTRDPRERFVSLANSRVTAAIKQIRLVGNLANKKNYQYESEDAGKIIRALQRELDELKEKFKGEEKSESTIFRL
jgi:ABC-type Fe3+-hydroxamate transport system substrate-binding protein